MKWRDRLAMTMVVAAASLPAMAGATSYDAVSSFSLTGSTSPFSYGYRVGSGPFIGYDTTTSACASISGLSCYYAAGFNRDSLPAVGKNTTGAPFTSGTVILPTDVLFMHPVGANSGLPAGDTIVRFTAPSTGYYSIVGSFSVLDVSPSGTNETIASTTTQYYTGTLTTAGQVSPFSFGANLAAGSSLDFIVGSAGSYYNDSTGLQLTLNVPEPMSLSLLGAGLVGTALIRRRRA